MRRNSVAAIALLALLAVLGQTAGGAGREVDVSGTWSFAVDVGEAHGTPTFVFIQKGQTLDGTVTNAQGQQKVTGTVKGDQAVFGFSGGHDDRTFTATYRGTIESAARMRGEVEFRGALEGDGTWVATKK